jgi:outer membrane protein assembly factor BamB
VKSPQSSLYALLVALATFTAGAAVAGGGDRPSSRPAGASEHSSPLSAADNWPSFRGVATSGVSDATDLPSSWDVHSGDNIRWSVEVPGVSHSSPVVWGDQIFVASAVGTNGDTGRVDGVGNDTIDDDGEFEWRLFSFDRNDGAPLWEVTAASGRPRAQRHEKASHANSTPSTDGRYVIAIFGSEGMFAYDLQGEQQWMIDLGVLDTGLYGEPEVQWGYAASPTIHGDRVFVQVDRHADSFIAAYDIHSGAEIWRTARREKNTWSTPLYFEHGGHELLVANGGNYIRAYDPADGSEVWRFRDDAEVKVPSPFAADGKIILAGGYPQGRPMYAFDPAAEGEVAADALHWRVPRGGPYTATPLAVAGLLYNVTDSGILSVYDLDDGQPVYRERLPSTFSASPVAADGKVFLASEDGVVYTLAVGREFELLAANEVGEPLFATPALVDGMVVVRGWNHLYGVAID